MELEICEILRTDDIHDIKVVVIVLGADPSLKGLTNGKRVVAKIYGPLYFFDDEGYLNPFLCIDKNYNHEAAT